jgi:microcystin-dependent protein
MPMTLTSQGLIFSNSTNTITDLVPVGTIVPYSHATTPPFFQACNGGALDRTTYATLFSRIGTTYGAGNGTTTFNVPDLRGEFVRFIDDGRGLDPGRSVGSFQGQQNLSHSHNVGGISANHTHGGNTGWVSNDHSHWFLHSNYGNVSRRRENGRRNIWGFGANTGGQNEDHFHGFGTGNVSNDHAHNIGADGGAEARPRNIAMVFMIRVI